MELLKDTNPHENPTVKAFLNDVVNNRAKSI